MGDNLISEEVIVHSKYNKGTWGGVGWSARGTLSVTILHDRLT